MHKFMLNTSFTDIFCLNQGEIQLKSIKGILVVGEKNIFAGLAQIITIAAEASSIVEVMFKAGYNDPALTERMNAVRALEKESDEVAFKLSEDITGGAISPNLLDNLIACTHVADDIVDIYFYLARDLSRMSNAKLPTPIVPQDSDWVSLFESMFGLAESCLAKLKQALSSARIPEILQLRKEIEELEEKGDDIKDAGFDKLYASAPNLHFVQFYHLSELLHKSDDILDSSEDLADLIVAVVTSIVK